MEKTKMSRDWAEGWEGQYRRMIRWQYRVLNTLNKNLQEDDGNEIYDFIYAFFQSCYHMRDWLVSDNAATNEEMKNLFKSSTELQLCRDICNATKHLLYKSPSIDSKPFIAREWDPFNKKTAGFYLYSDEKRPIPQLMKACIDAWENFIDSKGLKN